MRALISAAFIAVIRAQTVQLRLPKLKKDWFKNKQIRPLLYFCIQIIDLLWNINPVWWETTDMGLTIRCIWELKRRKCWHFTPCSYFLLFAVDKHDHWPNVLKVQMVKADEKTLPSLHSQEEESSSSSSEEEENDQRQNEDLFGKVVMVEGVTGSDKKKPSWYPALVSGHIIYFLFFPFSWRSITTSAFQSLCKVMWSDSNSGRCLENVENVSYLWSLSVCFTTLLLTQENAKSSHLLMQFLQVELGGSGHTPCL